MKRGLISVHFIVQGKDFMDIDVFIKSVKGYDSSKYAMRIIFPGRLSYPVAFRGFILFKANATC